MRILPLCGSLRTRSLNRRLLGIALAEREGAVVDRSGDRILEIPLYDGDVEVESGLPSEAIALAARIASADALLIASPEYNFSVPGVVKNAIDWISRAKPMPLRGKRALSHGLGAARDPTRGAHAAVRGPLIVAPFRSIVTSSSWIRIASLFEWLRLEVSR